MKLRVRPAGDAVELKILIEHPMESGLRRDESTGQLIPAHYIRQLNILLNGQTVIRSELGTAISPNPYFAFYLKACKPGDRINVTWVDNKDKTETGEIRVSF